MNSPTPLRIFVSCGTPHDTAQEAFLAAVEAHLAAHGCIPQTVGRSVYSARQPVEASRELIGHCDGAVVIAFERTRIVAGFDKPGSPQQTAIANEGYPTVWNQMEAAMAYAQKVPILTFVEPGLKRQGMLSDRFEWKAMDTALDPAFLLSEQFRQVFAEWLVLVRARSGTRPAADFDPGDLKIGKLIAQLSTKQAVGIVVFVTALAGSLAAGAFKAGQAWQASIAPPAGAAPQSGGTPAQGPGGPATAQEKKPGGG